MKQITFTLILLSVIFLFATSCKPKQLIVEKEKIVNHTEYKDRVRYDSIYMHDSVYIHQRNDTVYSTQIKTAYRYRLKLDTIHYADSIYVDKPFKVEVPKIEYRATNWQIITSFFGNIVLILGAIFGGWKFIKWKFLKK